MPRLFAGLEIPEVERDRLARLHLPMPNARWVEPDNLHLTLRFFGDVEGPTAEALAEELADIHLPPLRLQLDGLGCFGGRKPRAIWAGVQGDENLTALQRATERAARKAELEPEGRKFVPHVTLARLKGTRPDAVARFLERFAAYKSTPFTMHRFVLLSSRPGRGGGPYVVEEAFPLVGGPAG